LKNHTDAENITLNKLMFIVRTHWNADGTSNNGISKFIRNTTATIPKIATTNVANVSKSSN